MAGHSAGSNGSSNGLLINETKSKFSLADKISRPSDTMVIVIEKINGIRGGPAPATAD